MNVFTTEELMEILSTFYNKNFTSYNIDEYLHLLDSENEI